MHLNTISWPEVGHKFSKKHQFDVEQVRAFALAAGDTNPIHHDVQAAASSRFKRLIASGTHTTALILGLTASHFSENFSVLGVSFSVELLRPVFADASVLIEWEVVAVTVKSERSRRVELRGAMLDDEGRLCVQASGVVQVARGV